MKFLRSIGPLFTWLAPTNTNKVISPDVAGRYAKDSPRPRGHYVGNSDQAPRPGRTVVRGALFDSRMQTDGHISPHELERYQLNQTDETERALIAQHLLWCQFCIDRRDAIEQFIRLAQERQPPSHKS